MKTIFFVLLASVAFIGQAAEQESKQAADKLFFRLPEKSKLEAAIGEVDAIFYGLDLGEQLEQRKFNTANIETLIETSLCAYYSAMDEESRKLIIKNSTPKILKAIMRVAVRCSVCD